MPAFLNKFQLPAVSEPEGMSMKRKIRKTAVCLFFVGLAFCLGGPVFLHAGPQEDEPLQAGIRHMADREYDAAVTDFQKAAQKNESDPEILHQLGVALIHTGELEKAQTTLEKAIALKPDYAEAYFNIGLIYANYRQDPLGAKEYFEETLRLDPDFAEAYHALGLVKMMAESKPEEAATLFSQSVRLDPNLAQAHFGLGMAYILMGKPQEVPPIVKILKELGQPMYASSLESLIRGDAVFLGEQRDQERKA